METFSLSTHQKDSLCWVLGALEAGINVLREEFPELKDMSSEKIITFLKEIRVLRTLDKEMKEDFQPCSSAYESALDAVGEKATAQVKNIAGRTANSSRITMKPGWNVSEYVKEMIRKSPGKKAYFAVQNLRLGETCLVPAKNFEKCYTTYISWNQLTNSPKAKVFC